MKTINVIEYSEKWTTGGIESFIMNIYRNIDNSNIRINIMTSQDETELYNEEILQRGGKKIVTLKKKYKSPILRTLVNFTNFAKELKKNECDILHLHICHGVAMVYAYIAKRQGVKRIIIHSHNTDIGKKNALLKGMAHNLCKRLFEKCATDYLSCSDLASQWLYTKKNLESDRIIIINNGIETEKFVFQEDKRNEFREKMNWKNKFVVGHIGRFGEQKNHEFLIDIFKEISIREENAILLLIGEGEDKNKIIEKVNTLGLKDKVVFWGVSKEIPKLLWSMDVFVLPSLFEGKPVTLIETQAAALKAYISDTITKTVKISEYIEYISLEKVPKEWAEKILDKKQYKRENTKQILLNNNYDIKQIAKEIETLYLQFEK